MNDQLALTHNQADRINQLSNQSRLDSKERKELKALLGLYDTINKESVSYWLKWSNNK